MSERVRTEPGASEARVSPAAPASATAPHPVQFTDQQHGVSDTAGPDGTFDVVVVGTTVARGALDGTFDVVDHAVASPALGGRIRIDRVLTRGPDTISIELHGSFIDFTETTHRVAGRWAISGGTGAYENLAGSGTFSSWVAMATHEISGTLEGVVLFSHSNGPVRG